MTDKEAMRLAGLEARQKREKERAADVAKALKLAKEEDLSAEAIGKRLGRSPDWCRESLRGLHSFKRRAHELANGPPAVGQ